MMNATAGEGELLAPVFALLGKRWTGSLLALLLRNGDARIAELRAAAPGLNERTLSGRLCELVDAGLVRRELTAGPPLCVTYRLTSAGTELGPALGGFSRWAQAHLPHAGGSHR
jgi:DNA-binding HxlR family transcriptional regulator